MKFSQNIMQSDNSKIDIDFLKNYFSGFFLLYISFYRLNQLLLLIFDPPPNQFFSNIAYISLIFNDTAIFMHFHGHISSGAGANGEKKSSLFFIAI